MNVHNDEFIGLIEYLYTKICNIKNTYLRFFVFVFFLLVTITIIGITTYVMYTLVQEGTLSIYPLTPINSK
jgi:hypothetical protein